MSYADDAYVALAFNHSLTQTALSFLEGTFKLHCEWLERLGMVCNKEKTNFAVFGRPSQDHSIILGDNIIKSKNSLKVLGIEFENNLKWGKHVTNVLNKLKSKTYSLRLLNKILPRPLHLQVIHSHFFSHITYGISLWGANIRSYESKQIDTLINKLLRLHCFDFHRRIPNTELHRLTGCRSFKSLRTIFDACTLHQICTEALSTPLTLRLMEQSYTRERVANRVFFFDFSSKQTGKSSFVNRAKSISETIPFDWMICTRHLFKFKMKATVPLSIG